MSIEDAYIYISQHSSDELFEKFIKDDWAFFQQEFFDNYEFCFFVFYKLQMDSRIPIDCANSPLMRVILMRFRLNSEFAKSFFGEEGQPAYFSMGGHKCVL
jgi:hypothetical protein